MSRKFELIRRLTEPEREEAMQFAAFSNIIRNIVPRVTIDELDQLIERDLAEIRMLARYWDELQTGAPWPQHYFETRTISVAGPMGWLCWVDDDEG